ncbi:MAG: hypothetical protein PUJ35_07920 [Ruminococcus bromii]|nr:hypothetical protein [Ruminococcus bromii]MDD7647157.1 hypothetical protein [Ruminococcus bromii]
MNRIRIHRGRHYRRRRRTFFVRRMLCRFLDCAARHTGRHGRFLMRMRAKLNGGRI